jgi:predicted site-specific integrase-resolvase
MKTRAFSSATEIAERYDVEPKTVRKWAQQGLIPAMRLATGRLRFDVRKVDEALIVASARPVQEQ